jgi:hypothetical protein|tara:strand:+ start:375 stop:644 length:270 start_codon:yes stop_codon:yes gene_type:complete
VKIQMAQLQQLQNETWTTWELRMEDLKNELAEAKHNEQKWKNESLRKMESQSNLDILDMSLIASQLSKVRDGAIRIENGTAEHNTTQHN